MNEHGDNGERAASALAPSPQADRVTASLLKRTDDIVAEVGAAALFVYVDALNGRQFDLSDELQEKAFFITKTASQDESQRTQHHRYIRVPNVPLTRMGQIKIAVFLALSRGLIRRGDVIVCLTGLAATLSAAAPNLPHE